MFEAMDWGVEIKRISAAFKIECKCFFSDTSEAEIGISSMTLHCPTTSTRSEFPHIGEAELSVEYSETYRYYSLDRLVENRGGWDVAEVMMRWDNSIIRIQSSDSFVLPMAEALFCLGLLTPGIEQELEVTVTAHQKAEWTLDYARRLEAEE